MNAHRREELWIIEPDKNLQARYKALLSRYFRVIVFDHLEEVYPLLENPHRYSPSLILLEVCCEGIQVHQLVKTPMWKKLVNTPIWLITELDELFLIRHLFDHGIQDYFSKPVHTTELLFKIELFEQKKREQGEQLLQHKAGIPTNEFTHVERCILNLFLQKSRRTLTKEEIICSIWGRQTSVHPKTINVHMHNLRKKISRYDFVIEYDRSKKWILSSLKCESEDSYLSLENEADE